MTLQEKLQQELLGLYPDIPPTKAQKWVDRYYRSIQLEIIEAFDRPKNRDEDELSIEGMRLRQTCGQITYRKRRRYLFEFMQQQVSTSLVIEIYRGQQGRLKRVRINPEYRTAIMQAITDEYDLLEPQLRELTGQELRDLRTRADAWITIDPESLTAYIQDCRERIQTSQPGPYQERIQENQIQARRILALSEQRDGVTQIPERYHIASTGRRYGLGHSLGSQRSQVRHAALGVCHRYDGQAHSFAVMASIARAIQPDLKCAAIEDYIRKRHQIRQQISQSCGVPEERIKRAFTSLGFGARPIRTPFRAIRRELGSDQAYDSFMQNAQVRYILEDTDRVNQCVASHFPPEGFEIFGRRYQPDPDKRQQSVNQRLSWIYQAAETYLMQEFQRIVREATGQLPLLQVHDCLYYRQPIPAATLLDCHYLLREELGFSLVRFEHEAIYPITTPTAFQQRSDGHEQDLAHHHRVLQQEQQRAQLWLNQQPKQTSVQPRGTTEFEHRLRWIQLLDQVGRRAEPDVTDYEYEYEYDYTEQTEEQRWAPRQTR